MSVKRIGLSCLVVALWVSGVVQAQAPALPPNGSETMPLYTPGSVDQPSPYAAVPPAAASGAVGGSTFASSDGGPPPAAQPPVVLGLPSSPYLNYMRSPCCCGKVGSCGGPLGYELFVRSGIAFPIGPGIFEKYLHPGWDIEGGGRLLFFDPTVTKAWTISLSVSNIFNRTGNANQSFEMFNVPVRTSITVPGQTNVPGSVAATTPVIANVPQVTATVSSLNMTFVNVGFGREWYLLGTANPGQMQGCNWRVGFDGGGRYGSAMVQFNELQHHTDVVGGLYAAIHSDVEYPFRCGIVQAGIRYEYNYIWTSLLQSQNNGDYQSMNLLFQIGMRY